MVKAEDNVETNMAQEELTFLHNKKYQAIVVRARLTRMSCEATNMVHKLRTEKLRHV